MQGWTLPAIILPSLIYFQTKPLTGVARFIFIMPFQAPSFSSSLSCRDEPPTRHEHVQHRRTPIVCTFFCYETDPLNNSVKSVNHDNLVNPWSLSLKPPFTQASMCLPSSRAKKTSMWHSAVNYHDLPNCEAS